MQLKKLYIFLILSAAAQINAAESVINYSSPKTVYDFQFKGDTVLVATSGGLYSIASPYTEGTLSASTVSSPDPNITALCYDAEGNLWTGSSQGYLTRRGRGGKITSSKSYFSAGWGITSLFSRGKFLIVGSNNGLSLFNTETMSVEKNSTRFGNFSGSKVNIIRIVKDTLFAGLDEGVARLLISGDRLTTSNFYDPSIWDVKVTKEPVKALETVSGQLKNYSKPAALFKGKLLHTDSTNLYYGTELVGSFPSHITVIKARDKQTCWIGTEHEFFYSWDGAQLKNYTIGGMSLNYANKILVTRNGGLWVMPRIGGMQYPWWRAFNFFSGNTWSVYSPANSPQMGNSFGDDMDSRAMAESSDGRIWLGTSGGQIKCFNPALNDWSRYCNFARNFGDGKFYHTVFTCPDPDWAKCDAIAQDSSGYMWFTCWQSLYGSLICYDPRFEPDAQQTDPSKAHYRRFFPQDHVNYSFIPRSLIVDKSGNIILGGEEGKITVFRHNGDPLKNGITVVNTFTDKGIVNDMSTTDDLITRIATSEGIFEYDPLTNKLTEMEEIGAVVSAIEHENQHILWMGVPGEGVVRLNLANESRSTFSITHGLISNIVTDLEIDRENGVLWVGTALGVSRLALGYKLTTNSSSDVNVFPNPYSRSRHDEIKFRNLPPKSNVIIYSSGGKMVSRAEQIRDGVEGAFCIWKPSTELAPGTYFYSVQSAGKSSRKGKILITP